MREDDATARAAACPLGRLLALAAGLAAASLLLSAAPGYDPWAWLVWGREIAGGDLDTSGGPSWKPLPALAAAPLSLTGEAAPQLWLFVARFSWIAAALFAAALAVRLIPRAELAAVPGGALAIGGLAAAALVLFEDGFTPWLRQGAAGLSEPLLVGLLLGAALARLEDRRRLALLLVFGASLLRPEAWVLLALLLVEAWRAPGADARRIPRPGLIAVAAAVPLLWFLPDLIGSGDAFTGAGRAREAGEPAVLGARDAMRGLFVLPLAALWAGAAVALAAFWERRLVRELALGAGLWAAQVAALSALGYAGLPRFNMPAAAAVAVLGAVGMAHAVTRMRGAGKGAVVVVSIAVLALAVQGGWRAGELLADAREVGDRAEREGRFLAVADTEPVRGYMRDASGCRWIHLAEFLHGPAVSWRLDLRLRDVRPLPSAASPGGVVIYLSEEEPSPEILAGAEPLAAEEGAVAVDLPCPS